MHDANDVDEAVRFTIQDQICVDRHGPGILGNFGPQATVLRKCRQLLSTSLDTIDHCVCRRGVVEGDVEPDLIQVMFGGRSENDRLVIQSLSL